MAIFLFKPWLSYLPPNGTMESQCPSSFIVSYNITSINHNQRTNIHYYNHIIMVLLQISPGPPQQHVLHCAALQREEKGPAAGNGELGHPTNGKDKSDIEESISIFLCTFGILFHVEWCIRQLWCFSITIFNITSIAYNHHTHNDPLLNI